jgi:hypothetical protein
MIQHLAQVKYITCSTVKIIEDRRMVVFVKLVKTER